MTYIVTISTCQGGDGKVKGNILPTEGATLLDQMFTLQGQDFYLMTAMETAIVGLDHYSFSRSNLPHFMLNIFVITSVIQDS